MRVGTLIHTWLRHSNRCSQNSSLQNLKQEVTARQPFLASNSDGVSLAASQSLEMGKKKWKLGKLQELEVMMNLYPE
jgi:hypothetical protein